MAPVLESAFTFLFKYSPRAYAQGEIVLQPALPLIALVVIALGALAIVIWATSRLRVLHERDRWVLGAVRLMVFALVIGCLVRPMLVVSTAVPQRNVLAVMLDDSRSMRIRDGAGNATRLAAVQRVFADSAALVRRLGERFSLRFFRFGPDASPTDGAARLTAAASRTDLARSLEAARQELTDLPVAGLVVVTDGADNAAGDLAAPLLGLRARNVPVYTVGVGSERFERDIAVDRVALPLSALEGGGAVAEATLSIRGLAGRDVTVTAEADGRIVATEQLRLGDERDAMQVALQIPPLPPGLHSIAVKVTALEGETITENNEARSVLRVRPGREKVLYFEGEPRPELAFLRRAIAGDTALQLVSLVRSAEQKYFRIGVDDSLDLRDGFPSRRDDLFRYRAIVLGSVEAAYFSTDQLRMLAEFVDRRGGGLIVLGGRSALAEGGFSGTPLAEVLPLMLDRVDGEPEAIEVMARPTPAGLAQPSLQLAGSRQASAARWDSMAPVSTVNRLGSLKPGATMLLAARPVAGGADRPLLAYQRYGRGMSAVLGTQDTWRWQMDPRTPNDDATHATLWRQLLRWSLDAVPERVDVALLPERVGPGEPVTVRARVSDAEFLDVNDAMVTARVTPPIGEPFDLSLDRTHRADGTYSASFTAPDAGAYRIETTARRGTDTTRAPDISLLADTLGADVERAELRTSLLQRIADETGGKYYTIDNASRLSDDVMLTRSGITARDARDLWDMPAVLLGLLLLLGGEWGYRRWRGLA